MSRSTRGPRVLVTRSADGNAELAERLRERAMEPVELAVFRTVPCGSDALASLLRDARDGRLAVTDLVVTSPTAARRLAQVAAEAEVDLAALARGWRVAAVGTATRAALAQAGVPTHILPATFDGDPLVTRLTEAGVTGRTLLLPRNAEARDALVERLEAAGARVLAVDAYRVETTPELPGRLRACLDAGVDGVAAASSNTARRLVAAADAAGVGARLRATPLVAIGERTAGTARGLGFARVEASPTSTLEGLVATLDAWWKRVGDAAPEG